MTDIAISVSWQAADDLLNPLRKLCDPTHRYSYEAYFRADYIEVRAIDCGPVAEKVIRLVPSNSETVERTT